LVAITEAIGVQAKFHAIDFSKRDDAAWNGLTSALSPLDIGVLGSLLALCLPYSTYSRILVNNVGKSQEMPTDFVDVTDQERNDILEVNIFSTLRVTKIVLPGLLARSVHHSFVIVPFDQPSYP
jgi:17beta-estradiol 17-dehydrogenase / very-long-chain 3-oxoacyl-CoA reductase